MGQYIARRLIYLVLVLFAVSAITFGLMHAVPGGPFNSNKSLPPEIISNLEKHYNLDGPLIVQYADYLYEVMVPHITSEMPTNAIEDDYLITVNIGSIWIKWMNFGPSYKSRIKKCK